MDLQEYRSSDLEKARTADLLRIVPKGRSTVLDVGARDGHFSKRLTEHFASVTALDLEKPAFEYPGIVPVAGNVTHLDFPNETFDCVFCTEVLEHIPDVRRACGEIVRVARHEIVIGVPFKQDIRLGRMTCSACGQITPPWGHVNSFDERRIMDLFPGLRLMSKSFVARTREATNQLSMYLMDRAGNPWGTYNDNLHCQHCGVRLQRPTAGRTLGAKVCSALAYRMNRVQSLFTKPHGNWIHVVFSKTPN